jgi:hypothetical protein
VDGIVYVADNMDDIMQEKSEHPKKKTNPKNLWKKYQEFTMGKV